MTITSATTTNQGSSYSLIAPLTADQKYTLTVVKSGYTFGSPKDFTVASLTSVPIKAESENSNRIEITFSKPRLGSISDSAAFTVTGAVNAPQVTAVAVSGREVTLTLSQPLAVTDRNISVSYTPTTTSPLSSGRTSDRSAGQGSSG